MPFLRFAPSNCFGCSETNAAGLKLRFRRDGDRIVCDHVVPESFMGGPGVVHGGVQAVMLDEVMCAAVTFLEGTRVLTGELKLRYRRPCPIWRPLRVAAWIVSLEDRYARVRGEIRDPEGAALTTAEGKFYYDRSRS